jgi:hypothetical protein
MSKQLFFNENLTEDVYMTQHEGFVDPKHTERYANFKSPFMDCSRDLGVGICVLMK